MKSISIDDIAHELTTNCRKFWTSSLYGKFTFLISLFSLEALSFYFKQRFNNLDWTVHVTDPGAPKTSLMINGSILLITQKCIECHFSNYNLIIFFIRDPKLYSSIHA